jgi:hypothetical protein
MCDGRFATWTVKNELQMRRWIQSPATELKDLEQELKTKLGNGHQCKDPQTSVKVVELHVDLRPSSHEKMNATTTFGGHLSVQMPPNAEPLIGFGQDECIFKLG